MASKERRLRTIEGQFIPRGGIRRVYATVPRPQGLRDGTVCLDHPGCRLYGSGQIEKHYLPLASADQPTLGKQRQVIRD